jgi:Family of unknown function (DUF5367)
MKRALAAGLLLWIVGTVAIRIGGQRILAPDRDVRTAVLYLASLAAMAVLIPRVWRRLKLEKNSWFQAVTLLILPTLILDPFSCLFFSRVFPNIDPAAAGVFGGWMLICCGGAVAGVWLKG